MSLFTKFFLVPLSLFSFLVYIIGVHSVSGEGLTMLSKEDIVSSFRYYENVFPNVTKPTVVEIPFSAASPALHVFSVLNLNSDEFEPYYFYNTHEEIKSTIKVIGIDQDTSLMSDGSYNTYVEFPLTNQKGQADITFTFDKPIASDNLLLVLDQHVTIPETIALSAVVGGVETIVLAQKKPSIGQNTFPKTVSSVWHITFQYVQPLRIAEIKFNDFFGGVPLTGGLRFLAQPSTNYQIYFDTDRNVISSTKESADLVSNLGVMKLPGDMPMINGAFKPEDSDGDGVPDLKDNCISFMNSNQEDTDGNGRGEVCEDYDHDGILNVLDNCRDLPNLAQEDTDADGLGNVCDNKDNRVTERLPWLPWAGIGIAAIIIFGLFMIVLKRPKQDLQ
ncbi:MAG: thrombospondin type 3 repeat-containing protein [Candidatus Paceibacterota bacterium]